MKLSPRLQKIADSIKNRETLADIGTDHAYLPIYLIRKGSVRNAIATDVNRGPIEIAQGRIKANRMEEKIETRLGSGLSVLEPKEADIIVIAGMGGMLIADILEADMEVSKSAESIVLQPMLDSAKLRAYLLKKGFEITDEELVKEEAKLYEVLWVRYLGIPQPAPQFLEIGPKLIEKKHPLLGELLQKKTRELQNVIDKLQEVETEAGQRKLNECLELQKYYNEVKQWV
ncbi:MAG: SAM-dependent methyltransferase [Clostridia bacterium]|nr:SAM-dependent methyltransferase [Clostridia bacterium]